LGLQPFERFVGQCGRSVPYDFGAKSTVFEQLRADFFDCRDSPMHSRAYSMTDKAFTPSKESPRNVQDFVLFERRLGAVALLIFVRNRQIIVLRRRHPVGIERDQLAQLASELALERIAVALEQLVRFEQPDELARRLPAVRV
jgi:hypothetical protein